MLKNTFIVLFLSLTVLSGCNCRVSEKVTLHGPLVVVGKGTKTLAGGTTSVIISVKSIPDSTYCTFDSDWDNEATSFMNYKVGDTIP